MYTQDQPDLQCWIHNPITVIISFQNLFYINKLALEGEKYQNSYTKEVRGLHKAFNKCVVNVDNTVESLYSGQALQRTPLYSGHHYWKPMVVLY